MTRTGGRVSEMAASPPPERQWSRAGLMFGDRAVPVFGRRAVPDCESSRLRSAAARGAVESGRADVRWPRCAGVR